MRVLVAYGSKMGGTRGLAEMVGSSLEERHVAVDIRPAGEVVSVDGYDAVIVGGALYAGRWHRSARRLVRRHRRALQQVPVWLFSSGPLDDSAARHDIAPTAQVARLMAQVEAVGHVTFGGRLSEEPQGFMARAMAKKRAGDWRDAAHVDRWVAFVVGELHCRRHAALSRRERRHACRATHGLRCVWP